MIELFIRYFSITFWALFIFQKSLNIKPSNKDVALRLIFSSVLAVSMLGVRMLSAETVPIAILVLSCTFNKVVSGNKLGIIAITSTIALGIKFETK